MIAPPLTVVKVGGALLGGAGELAEVAAAAAARRLAGERLLMVVSALRGVTDRLDRAAHDVLDPRSGGEIVRDVMQHLQRQHAAAVAGLPEAEAVLLRLRPVLDGVERLLTGIRLTGELTPRARDLVLAHGERLSAPLVAAAVRGAGADARAVSAEEGGLAATGPFAMGSADIERSTAGLAGLQHELHDRVLVLTGFYGVNADGDVVLFGRGGSDYTAGVVAAGLSADHLELWKDVPGFMTADPRAVPSARVVPELSYDEACELGWYGARILHPRCLDPLRGRDTRVVLRPIAAQVDAPSAPGTRLVEQHEGRAGRVAALTVRRSMAVVRAHGAAMVNRPGIAGRVLSALGDAGVNAKAIASSMTSVSCTVDEVDAPLARRTLRLLLEGGGTGISELTVEPGAALLGVVGDGVADDTSIAARMLTVLAELGVRVELISHGPGDVGLSCVVPGAQLDHALAELHAAFFPEVAPRDDGDDGDDRAGDAGDRARGAAGRDTGRPDTAARGKGGRGRRS